MMQRRTAMAAVLLGVAAAMLGGCYQSPTPAMHEPGVYKGKADPLRAKLESDQLQAKLDARFQRAAQDR